jgi:ketosteroid isomerase-like protein
MSERDRLQLARDSYRAYECGDRALIESLLTEDFTFYSPADEASTAPGTSSAAGQMPG